MRVRRFFRFRGRGAINLTEQTLIDARGIARLILLRRSIALSGPSLSPG